MKETIFPENLKKGAKIAIVSPAGFVEVQALEKALSLIESKGYIPVLGQNTLGKYINGYPYSGTEQERIDDLNWALNQQDISAIWATRGGYGSQHLVEHLTLSGFKKKPKWYIGYSDNTVINSFLLNKGYASIHGQTIKTASFGVSEESYENIFSILEGQKTSYTVARHTFNKQGMAEGELVGGNLALVYALLGTSFSYDFTDKILFIEDIGEHLYALDRMLMSLDLSGAFSKIKGLIIGGMTNMGNEKDNMYYEEPFDISAYEIISQRIEKYNFPTLFGFPNGHIFDNRPLIIGANTRIEVSEEVKVNF